MDIHRSCIVECVTSRLILRNFVTVVYIPCRRKFFLFSEYRVLYVAKLKLSFNLP